MKSGLLGVSLLKNKKGISIIQVLMAAGMTSIVSLGVVQMIENSRRMQRRTTLVSALSDIKQRLESNMRDQVAFNNTINGNTVSPWTEMKTGSPVTENSLSSPLQFQLFDAANQGLNLLGLAAADSTGTRYTGYTERGGICYDFNPILGYGSDNCPISYRLLVVADCAKPGVTTCRDPNLTMVGRLVFNPSNSTSSTMNNWRGLIPTVTGSSLVTASEKYDAEVRRTASSINKSFYISASVSPAGAPVLCHTASVTNTGGGECSVGSFADHPLQKVRADAPGWVIESDPNGLLASVNTTTGYIKFSTTGLYRCMIIAKAFSTNMTLQLWNVSTTTQVGTGTAVLGQYTEGEARIDVSVNVTNIQQPYIIRQQCDNNAVKSCTLGFAKQGYTQDTMRLLTMSCDRMDVMF